MRRAPVATRVRVQYLDESGAVVREFEQEYRRCTRTVPRCYGRIIRGECSCPAVPVPTDSRKAKR